MGILSCEQVVSEVIEENTRKRPDLMLNKARAREVLNAAEDIDSVVDEIGCDAFTVNVEADNLIVELYSPDAVFHYGNRSAFYTVIKATQEFGFSAEDTETLRIRLVFSGLWTERKEPNE